MTTYKTVQGDTWDLISYRVYGTGNIMSELMKANPKYMNVGVFSAGVVLNIPAIDTTEIDENIPPWLR